MMHAWQLMHCMSMLSSLSALISTFLRLKKRNCGEKEKKKRHTCASITQRFTLKAPKQWLIVCFERKVLFFFRQAMAHRTPAALPKGSAQFLCWLGLSAVAAAAGIGIASPALPSPWWPHRCAQAGSPCPQDLPSHK